MGCTPLHVATIRAHAPSALLAQLTKLAGEYGGKGHTLFFALSANFPHPEDMQAVVERLNTFHKPPTTTATKEVRQMKNKNLRRLGRTVGCLADSPAGDARLSCAVAVFNSKYCVPFRSSLAGRVQPQVGRWHAFRKSNEDAPSIPDWTGDKKGGAVDWDAVWSQRSLSQSPSAPSLVPTELQDIPPYQINTLLSLTAPHPDALTRVLSTFLTNAPALSTTSILLTAAPTHFTTGRPVTLFLDGEIYGEGAVGVALLRDVEEPDPEFRTEFVGVRRLGGEMEVTSNEGNMINELDGGNPTRLLLSALDAAGMGAPSGGKPLARTFKEDAQFALGVLDASEEITKTYKITAGDPASRGGSLALDAPSAPGVGSTVQFLHCPSNAKFNWTPPPRIENKIMAFMTVPEPTSSTPPRPPSHKPQNAEVEILEDAFVVASTQGFIVMQTSGMDGEEGKGEEGGEPWACSLPGGVGVLEWDPDAFIHKFGRVGL